MKTTEQKTADLELYRRLMDLGAELYRIREALRQMWIEEVNLLELRELRGSLTGLEGSAKEALRTTDLIIERLEEEE